MSDIEVISNGASGVKVKYALPSTIDTQDGVVPVTCSPAPGKRFQVGTTTTFDVIVTRKKPARP